jgi:hypothetical protein
MLARCPSPEIKPIPYGLVSLSDMINFSLHNFIWMLKLLGQEHVDVVRKASADLNATLTAEDRERFEKHFKFFSDVCTKMVLQTAIHRLGHISILMRNVDVLYLELKRELETLSQAVENDIETERFYHYPRAKGLLVVNYMAEWHVALKGFPSAKDDIEAAVDCYALAHSTASVFHSMRAAEQGLRGLAKAQKIGGIGNKPIEWNSWQEIIRELNKKYKAMGQMSAGTKKDAELAFYGGALADMNAFKDEYRNMVMHVRASYDELQALRALERVRDFMNRISARIDENGKKVRP